MLHFDFQKKFSDAGKRAHVSLHEKESEAQALLRSRVETRELRGAPSMTVTNDRSARRARQRGLQCGTSSVSCRRACGQKECSRQITIESSTVWLDKICKRPTNSLIPDISAQLSFSLPDLLTMHSHSSAAPCPPKALNPAHHCPHLHKGTPQIRLRLSNLWRQAGTSRQNTGPVAPPPAHPSPSLPWHQNR